MFINRRMPTEPKHGIRKGSAKLKNFPDESAIVTAAAASWNVEFVVEGGDEPANKSSKA